MIAAMHPVSSKTSAVKKDKRPNKNITVINIYIAVQVLLQQN
jgi:hypothetical protein